MKSRVACSFAFQLDRGVAKESMDTKESKSLLAKEEKSLSLVLVTLTKNLIKFLHVKKDCTMDLRISKMKWSMFAEWSNVENGPSFFLNLDGQGNVH